MDTIINNNIEGKITKEKADELEKKKFEEMQTYKNKMNDARDKLVELGEMTELQHKTVREKAVYIIDKIYVRRLSRFVCELEAYNKITGEKRTYDYQTKDKRILHMRVETRPTLGYKRL